MRGDVGWLVEWCLLMGCEEIDTDFVSSGESSFMVCGFQCLTDVFIQRCSVIVSRFLGIAQVLFWYHHN